MTGGRGLAITLLPLVFAIGSMSEFSFQIDNNCSYPVWTGNYPSMGTPGGMSEIGPGELLIIYPDAGWRGHLWLRTSCSGDPAGSTSNFTCLTGDCHSGVESCDGRLASVPVTLLDFLNFTCNATLYAYSVNVRHGFNVPAAVSADGCPTASCAGDVIGECPVHLQFVDKNGFVIGCMSDCDITRDPKDCCAAGYGGRDKCRPSGSQQLFKRLCPLANTWKYDEKAVFACAPAAFTVTLCP